MYARVICIPWWYACQSDMHVSVMYARVICMPEWYACQSDMHARGICMPEWYACECDVCQGDMHDRVICMTGCDVCQGVMYAKMNSAVYTASHYRLIPLCPTVYGFLTSRSGKGSQLNCLSVTSYIKRLFVGASVCVCVCVTNFLNYYKMANNGWIL